MTAVDLFAELQSALEDGALRFQRCQACGHAWLPPRTECPQCLADAWAWEDAGGRATLVSWVVYHRAYHASHEDRVPYPVLLVQLAEGPRLVANTLGDELVGWLQADAELELEIERTPAGARACFVPAGGG